MLFIILNVYIKVFIDVVKIVCKINKYGVMNKNVNFNGLVIFIMIVVNVVGISNVVIFLWFFLGVVVYIVKVIFKYLNIFLFFWSIKL